MHGAEQIECIDLTHAEWFGQVGRELPLPPIALFVKQTFLVRQLIPRCFRHCRFVYLSLVVAVLQAKE